MNAGTYFSSANRFILFILLFANTTDLLTKTMEWLAQPSVWISICSGLNRASERLTPVLQVCALDLRVKSEKTRTY